MKKQELIVKVLDFIRQHEYLTIRKGKYLENTEILSYEDKKFCFDWHRNYGRLYNSDPIQKTEEEVKIWIWDNRKYITVQKNIAKWTCKNRPLPTLDRRYCTALSEIYI
jgi:hypothetical protein